MLTIVSQTLSKETEALVKLENEELEASEADEELFEFPSSRLSMS